MENKTKKKTKKEIEAEHPLIHPEDCPGALIKWVQERDERNFSRWLEVIREELSPVKRFMKIASTNRIWLVGLTATITAIMVVLILHIAMR